MSAKFLLVSTRPEEEAVHSEYKAYLKTTGLESENLDLIEFDLVGLPPLELNQYQGVFIAGSPYGNATLDRKISPTWQKIAQEISVLLEEIIALEKPLLVTGNATGVLLEKFGAILSKELQTVSDLVEIELTREGRTDPVFFDLPDFFDAFCSMVVKEICLSPTLEAEIEVLARSRHCPLQAFRLTDRFYASQFSPELDALAISNQLQAFEDAGYFTVADPDSLVLTGRYNPGKHQAGKILRNFVKLFG